MYNFYQKIRVHPPGCTLKKILLIMKLTTLLLITAILQVSAKTFAQKVSLAEKNAPLASVFNDIRAQTGYDFLFTTTTLKDAKPVSIDVKNVELADVLKKIFDDQPLQYSIEDKSVVVSTKELPLPDKPLPPKDVTGQVKNKQGESLVNATVLIKRTRTGVLTNQKGDFVLRDVYPTDTIIVSYLGYKPLYIRVGSETVFNLVMQETNNVLDQVVVQAYGQTSQRLATGDIGTVSGADIAKQPVMNPLQALFGKVPGLVITQTSGYASANVGITIRGQANIGGDSSPLMIVDGVPMALNGTGANNGVGVIPIVTGGNVVSGPAQGQSALLAINPSDIESISVLKDADATSIYGSRGADGVIIITTKKGKAGKTKLDASIYQGVQEVTQRYPMLNTQQYIAMREEAFRNDGITPTVLNAYDLFQWGNGYTDWQKKFWGGVGKTIDPQLSLSGGNNLTTFSISGGYHRETTIFNYSGSDQRVSFHVNINHKSLNEKLNISFTGFYSYTQDDLIGLPALIGIAPNAPGIFDSAGKLNYEGWRVTPFYPFSEILQPYQSGTGGLTSDLRISYQLFKGLTFTNNLGFANSNLNNYSLSPIVSQDPAFNPTGTSNFERSVSSQYIVEPQLEYKRLIGKGNIDILIGGTMQYQNLSAIAFSGLGYVNDNLINSVSNAPSKNADDGYYQYKYESVFSRVNYNWDDKYIINITATRDGSSRFGSGRQFGNFASGGLAWVFTEEKWAKDHLSFLSFGKFRGSYGTTGSDQISDYQYLTSYSANGTLPYQGIASYIPTKLANPLLHWQTNKKLEGAIDMGFLKDRLTLNISWYRNRIGDQLVQAILPAVTGFTGVYENFPATVQNTGWETTLNFRVIEKKDFDWTISFDAGWNKNKLLSFPNLQQSPYASNYTVGKPLSISYVIHYTGVNPQTGLYTFQDKNKDGQLDPYDYNSGLSDASPIDLTQKVMGGFTTDFRYKGWELDLYFNFIKQELRGSTVSPVAGQINTNQPLQALNRWQKPGDIAQYAKYTTDYTDASYAYFPYSDAAYSDGSYIKLRNAQLSYSLPDKWLKKMGMRSGSVNITAQNFLTLTKYNGIDPDVPGFGITLPPAKVITGGIQFSY